MLARTDTTESMVFWFTALLAVGAGLLAIPGWRPLQYPDWPLLVGVGLSGAVGQHFITEAFRNAPVSVVTPFEYTALVWGVRARFRDLARAARRRDAARRRHRRRRGRLPHP